MDIPITGIIHTRREGDTCIAEVKLRTRTGATVQFSASAPIAPIRAALARSQRGYSGRIAPEVGFGWGDIVGAASSVQDALGQLDDVAAQVANSKAVESLTNIVNDPRVASGAALASTIFPPIGATYGAVAAGTKLLAAAKGGATPEKEEEAKLQIMQVAQLANAGDPAAEAARGVLREINRILNGANPAASPSQLVRIAQQQRTLTAPAPRRARPRRRRSPNYWRRGISSASASDDYYIGEGWQSFLFSAPYRSVLQEAFDPSPAKAMRYLYRKGLDTKRRR